MAYGIVLIPSMVTYLFVMNGTVGIYNAFASGYYSFAAAIILVFCVLFLNEYSVSDYRKLAPNKKSIGKDFFKFGFWFLSTATVFGFAFRIVRLIYLAAGEADLVLLAAFIPLYGLAILGSAYLFHLCRFPAHNGIGCTHHDHRWIHYCNGKYIV